MKSFLIILTLLTCTLSSLSQTDTLHLHTYSIAKKKAGKSSYYFYNDQPSNKKVYDSIAAIRTKEYEKFMSCKPCYTIKHDLNNAPVFEGLFYQDCCVGVYTEYYPDGKIKMKGNYLQTKDNGNCHAEDGIFLYYSKEGILIKEENWSKGKLISTGPK